MTERKNPSRQIRDSILREAGYRCAVPTCNTTLAMDVHHIVEVSKCGSNELDNLLALCPTCHALYHRGTITLESIRHYKERLVRLNTPVDVHSELDTRVSQAIEQRERKLLDNEQRVGFALVAAEYSWRMCEVGVNKGERFKSSGYCCFVGPKLAITATEVVDWALEDAKEREGSPVIHTRRGLAPFAVRERFEGLGGVAIIEIGEIDDSYIRSLLAKHDSSIARMFYEPIQTPVRYRTFPFSGERVGFLHASYATAKHRSRMDLQFDSADVAFNHNCKDEAGKLSGEHMLAHVLTPVLSRVQYRGSPVFIEDGRLVGIIKNSILLDGELAWRPIISGVAALTKLSQNRS